MHGKYGWNMAPGRCFEGFWVSPGRNFLALRESSKRWSVWQLRPGHSPNGPKNYRRFVSDLSHLVACATGNVCQSCGAALVSVSPAGRDVCAEKHENLRATRLTRTEWDRQNARLD